MLTDLVFAAADQAWQVARAAVPWETYGGLDLHGIDAAKLGKLHGLLGADAPEQDWADEPIVEAGDDGPWVYVLPESFVARLAALDTSALPALAVSWIRSEDFDEWEPTAVRLALGEIAALAREAMAGAATMYLWEAL